MKRSLAIHNAHPRLRFNRTEVVRVIHILDADFKKSPLERGGAKRRGVSAIPEGELSIAFLTDPAIAKIHAAFMNDPAATDVITFEGDQAAGLAGEICVSADTARAYAKKHQRDFPSELTLYVVHGWLHLAGYDDLQPAKKRRMRAAEKRAMALLRKARAVPAFRLVRL
jgi:probable rRNA maturation factor